MNFQDYITDVTQKAADEAFRYALAVPSEKADWKPLDEGRSVLDQAREMAQCPVWAVQIITSSEPPKFEGPEMEAEMALMASWDSIETCKKVCEENLTKLAECFKSIVDEKLSDTKWLPFDGGRDFTVMEMMDYPRWNFTYHLGQIAYIQTLLGDKAMH